VNAFWTEPRAEVEAAMTVLERTLLKAAPGKGRPHWGKLHGPPLEPPLWPQTPVTTSDLSIGASAPCAVENYAKGSFFEINTIIKDEALLSRWAAHLPPSDFALFEAAIATADPEGLFRG
jgi:hypothetical protein